MGFVPKRKIYRLTFDAPDMAGLEVRMREVSLGEARRFRNATDDDEDELMAIFADRLVEWNVETEGGKPVPTTLAAVEEQGFSFVRAIVAGWLREMTEVPAPLEPTSDAGLRSEVASIPMETLSSSLAS